MNICEYELCSGCAACMSICPKGAVTMSADSEGFSRPVVNEDKCVNCGLCEKKCPVNNKEKSSVQGVYAAYSRNEEIRKSSSSGGIFAQLAVAVLDMGGVVFGAAFDENLRVVHKIASKREELSALMGSKYVQSDMSAVYPEIEKNLREGRKVLFSGTPCQCAGVKNAFGKHDGLILVDFICHGVPTPKLFEMYINENFEDVESISFRDKKRGWDEFSMRVSTKGGEYNVSRYKDPYIRMFLANVFLRPSCYNCSWKDDGFASDITLGDFWGISKVLPHMNDNKGTSVVAVRTQKGEELFESVSAELRIEKTELKKAVGSNAMYYKSTPMSEKREEFFERVQNGESFADLTKDFGKPLSSMEILKWRARNNVKFAIGKVMSLKIR